VCSVESLGVKVNGVRSKGELSLSECLSIGAIAASEKIVVHVVKANIACIAAIQSSF
jgi:hypothetical protein